MNDLLASAHRVLLKPSCAERDACLEHLAAVLEAAEQTVDVDASQTAPSPAAASSSALAPPASNNAAAIHKETNGASAIADDGGIGSSDGSAESVITAVLLADLVPPLLACAQQPRHQHTRSICRDTDETIQSQSSIQSSMPQPCHIDSTPTQPCPFAVRILALLVRAAQRRLAAHAWSVHSDAATGAVWYQPRHAIAATTSSASISAVPAATAQLRASRVESGVASSSASTASSPSASAEYRRMWPPTDIPTHAREPEWAQSLLLELPALTAPLRLLSPSTGRDSRPQVLHQPSTR